MAKKKFNKLFEFPREKLRGILFPPNGEFDSESMELLENILNEVSMLELPNSQRVRVYGEKRGKDFDPINPKWERYHKDLTVVGLKRLYFQNTGISFSSKEEFIGL